MKHFKRALRHLVTTAADGRKAFPSATLKEAEQEIAAGEKRHRAQVRLIVEAALPFAAAWHGMSPRERARELFAHYRVWDTEENCGVLLYVNLADRQVEIVADRGVGKTVAAHDWHAACRTLTHGFAEGKFHEGTLAALAQINALLEQHYPGSGGNANELPDKPLML
jgi:uncharacterized membrane protein